MRKKTLEHNIEDKKVVDKKVSVKKSEKNTLANVSSSNVTSDPSGLLTNSNTLPVIKTPLLYKDVSPEKYFILCDGRAIHNCKELADVLTITTDDVFGYHVTDTKNDFSNWINDVFLDHDLAKKISLLKNRIDMSLEIYRHMFDLLNK